MIDKSKIKTAYVLLGPPASGKDTQATLLSEKLNMPVIATGDVVRKMQSRGTQDGLKAAQYLKKGAWVPDDLIFKMLREYIKEFDLSGGVIFNAVPRTVAQCPLLEKLLKDKGIKIRKVFHLDTCEKSITRRVKNRIKEELRKSGKKRQDDDIEILKNRLREHAKTVTPILRYYKKAGLLARIDNERSINEVFAQILEEL